MLFSRFKDPIFVRRFAVSVLIVVVLVNLSGLWGIVIWQNQKFSRSVNIQTSPVTTNYSSQLTDLESRITAVEQAAAKTNLPVQTIAPQRSNQTNTVFVTTPSSSAKESVLFMGSGSTDSRDWTDIPSASLEVNMSNFSSVKEIHFEASLSIIGGEAHVRLVNKSTGAIFNDSELMNNASTSLWKSSPALHLPAGNALYSVQVKSTSGETAYLNGARLRIVTQ